MKSVFFHIKVSHSTYNKRRKSFRW